MGGVEISVIIPTRGRAEKLGRCVERLARQTFGRDRFEVLVGVDGLEPGDDGGVVRSLVSRASDSVRVSAHFFDHAGPGATRNRLARLARGRLILMLNDDVLPEPDLLDVHVREQARMAAAGVRGLVLGAAPWVRPAPQEDTLFDRLIRETSMVFFYDRMVEELSAGGVTPDHDWGFRHGWTLNLSVPREVFECAGGFDERLRFACYEDLEFTFRACGAGDERRRAVVRFAPGAVVLHDHRIGPEDYLRREAMMGRAAWEFAAAAPACAGAVFGRDIRSPGEVDYSRRFVERERPGVERLRETFTAWAKVPAGSVSGPHERAVMRALYEHHLPLKRWTWRRALVDAADARHH